MFLQGIICYLRAIWRLVQYIDHMNFLLVALSIWQGRDLLSDLLADYFLDLKSFNCVEKLYRIISITVELLE